MSDCQHYWKCEQTGESWAKAKCLFCGKEAMFLNYFDYDAAIHQFGGAFGERAYTPDEDWLIHEIAVSGKTWTR